MPMWSGAAAGTTPLTACITQTVTGAPPGALNWLTRMALGFNKGLLEIAEDLGAERVNEVCTAYAGRFQGIGTPASFFAS